MKIVIPAWGLGNVMFQYAFLCELRSRVAEGCCFFVNKRARFDHYGYELEKLFKVKPYIGLNFFQKAYIRIVEFLGSRGLPHYKLITWFFKEVWEDGNFLFHEDIFERKGNLMLRGTWQSPKYFAHVVPEIRETFTFDEKMVSAYTVDMQRRMGKCRNSVSVHIRRGDYTSGKYDALLLCCPLDYFLRAMAYVNSHVENPTFFVFSDDMEYVRLHIKADNVVFVDGNRGEDSWMDMFLMTKCSHNIIANSTFSWWGAFLNDNPQKMVIAPRKWWYYMECDEVVPTEWIRL